MILVILLSFVSFVAFPEKKDALLTGADRKHVSIEVSGSLGLYQKDRKCHKTYGNETLVSDEFSDWCSNIATVKNDPSYNPWIQYSIKGKQMKISSFSVRNGCCHYYCCCAEEDGKVVDYYCCCLLYTYSLQGSNDNKTWKVIHRVEKDNKFYYCDVKTFELERMSEPFVYFRFVLEEEWPGCPKAMQVNQIELYGESMPSGYTSYNDVSDDDDESISIIGRIKKTNE